jgi:hypothetical protein
MIRDFGLREYAEHIDWVFHAKIDTFHADDIYFIDTVPTWQPELDSLCNF